MKNYPGTTTKPRNQKKWFYNVDEVQINNVAAF